MNLLVDTHVFLWLMMDDTKLGLEQREVLNDASNLVYLSAASVFEMSIKAGIGKLFLPTGYTNNLSRIFTEFDVVELPVKVSHASAAGFLKGEHRDPFDRLLAAQSIVENLPIMTLDSKIRDLGAKVVW